MYTFLRGVVAASALLLLSLGAARADTYAVIINALDQDISLNGHKIAPMESAWTPLDASLVFPGGGTGFLNDMHAQCDGGWLLMGMGQLPTTYCIPLGFAEIGCVYAFVKKKDGLIQLDMTKVRGTACSDLWWEKHGKDIIYKAIDVVQTQQGNAAQALGAIVP